MSQMHDVLDGYTVVGDTNSETGCEACLTSKRTRCGSSVTENRRYLWKQTKKTFRQMKLGWDQRMNAKDGTSLPHGAQGDELCVGAGKVALRLRIVPERCVGGRR